MIVKLKFFNPFLGNIGLITVFGGQRGLCRLLLV